MDKETCEKRLVKVLNEMEAREEDTVKEIDREKDLVRKLPVGLMAMTFESCCGSSGPVVRFICGTTDFAVRALSSAPLLRLSRIRPMALCPMNFLPASRVPGDADAVAEDAGLVLVRLLAEKGCRDDVRLESYIRIAGKIVKLEVSIEYPPAFLLYGPRRLSEKEEDVCRGWTLKYATDTAKKFWPSVLEPDPDPDQDRSPIYSGVHYLYGDSKIQRAMMKATAK